MDLITWVRGQHRGIRFFFENAVLGVLTPEQLKERPGEQGNSIAWLMWHLARTEDVMVNSVIRGEPQLLTSDDWPKRLRLEDTHMGTGLSDDEVGKVTGELDPLVADEYWKTVADATNAWLKSISPEVLDEIPDMYQRLSEIPPILAGADNQAMVEFWRGRTAGFLFGATVINHGYIHVGEMQAIRGRLGVQAWF